MKIQQIAELFSKEIGKYIKGNWQHIDEYDVEFGDDEYLYVLETRVENLERRFYVFTNN